MVDYIPYRLFYLLTTAGVGDIADGNNLGGDVTGRGVFSDGGFYLAYQVFG